MTLTLTHIATGLFFAVAFIAVAFIAAVAVIWAGLTRCPKCRGWCCDKSDCCERRGICPSCEGPLTDNGDHHTCDKLQHLLSQKQKKRVKNANNEHHESIVTPTMDYDVGRD